ncbi:hypothetical protein ACFFQF_12985 [Haladaptatus pallidirubidus]|nr:hypothetical protein [Haladaptatus pallidirubidus]
MSLTVSRAGRYAFGVGTTALAALIFGIGIVHLFAAVPHAILPTIAGVLLFVVGVGVTPAGRHLIERLVEMSVTSRRVVLLLICASALCAATVGISVVFS